MAQCHFLCIEVYFWAKSARKGVRTLLSGWFLLTTPRQFAPVGVCFFMAKRFTDSAKWDDPWFMELPPESKLFWLYLLDNCDHAGIWKVNFRLASFHIGFQLCPKTCAECFGERVEVISGGAYWFIKKFIKYQYGGLNNDAVGRSVQKILNQHDIKINIAPTEGLPRGYQGAKDKDKVKDKDMVKAKDGFRGKKNDWGGF